MTLNAMDTDSDLLSDGLSSAMGTKTLITRNMVPESLPASNKGPAK
jgi:hypothetical protein